jgi:glycosyltransferase involved in cell wall biosynthesis
MRVLHITDFYYPYVGGVEQHVRTLSAELTARNHSVAVVTLARPDLSSLDSDGAVRVYRVRGTLQRVPGLFAASHRPWAPPFPDPEVVLQLSHIIAQEKPDIVHGHDWLARSFLPLKPTARAKFVMSLHYYTLTCAKKNLMYMQQEPCAGPALKKCLSCAAAHYGFVKGAVTVFGNLGMTAVERAAVDKYIVVSHATAQGNQLDAGQIPYEIIPNFLSPRRTSSPEIQAQLTQLPSEPFFLFVGDLRRVKGLHVLLQAYARLAQAPPLVLIGKPWADTPSELPRNVFMFQNWTNDAVLGAWARSFAGIVPSIWQEPFGIVVIEALANGRPVIGSNVGGIPDLITDGENGLLVPPDDDKALGAAMQQLIRNPALYQRLARGAMRRGQEYQAARVVPHIEQIYAALCAPTFSLAPLESTIESKS